MKFIYFHIDELNRDAVTASVVRDEAKKRGWNVIYGNRASSKLLKYFESVFDVVVLPKPTFLKQIFGYNNIPALKSKYIMLYTENIGIIANNNYPKMLLKGALDEEFMSGNQACVEKVSAFCFWGSQVQELVKKSYLDLAHKCYIVGHPRHDTRALVGTVNTRNTVGVISRYCLLNDYCDRNPILNIFDRYMKTTLYEYNNAKAGDFLLWERRGERPEDDLYLEAIDVKSTVQIISRLNQAGYKVSFKVHPRENFLTWSKVFSLHGLNVESVCSQVPFTHWAASQICVIGSPSTTFYDCLMVGVTPVSIANLVPRRNEFVSRLYEENNKLSPHIESPTSIDDILSLVRKSEDNFEISPATIDVLKLEANYPHCRDSGVRVGDVIQICLLSARTRTLKMTLGVYLYILLSFVLITAVQLYRAIITRSVSHSANFLLTNSVVEKINKLVNNSQL